MGTQDSLPNLPSFLLGGRRGRQASALCIQLVHAPVKLPLRKHFSHSAGQLLLKAASSDGHVANQNHNFHHEFQGRPQKELLQIGELLMPMYF